MPATVHQLERLAKSLGVITRYKDIHGQQQRASSQTMLAIANVLGAEISSLADVAAALFERQRQICATVLEPVQLAWDGAAERIQLQLPDHLQAPSIAVLLQFEQGNRLNVNFKPTDLRRAGVKSAGNETFVVWQLPAITQLPQGYHRLELEFAEQHHEALLISAPTKTYAPSKRCASWGVFAPLYALHSKESWGAGSLAELEALWSWTTDLGGGLVATLPLLAGFLDEPFDPSPYSPLSRMFWNEFYLDVRRVPELSCCAPARQVLESGPFLAELADLRAMPLVDYRRQMALKRQVLEKLSQQLFAQAGPRREQFNSFLDTHPVLGDYARFRAVLQRQGRPWPVWPQAIRDGQIRQGEYDESAFRYHAYVQWLAHEQLAELADRFRTRGPGLYLDLPLGVHRDGYDPWRERNLFVREMSGGAPPDTFFTKGQNWGFAPMNPAELRRQGYRHQIACLRHHLQMAGLLRMDHVMGLHRLYWIPQGMDAADGAYVQYPAEELYAILCLESHRSRSLIAGENLGTVPPAVNTALRRHRIRPTYVAQYELDPSRQPPLSRPPRNCVASLNTHDMPPFASFWREIDLADLRALDLIDEAGAKAESLRRQAIRRSLVAELLGPAAKTDGEAVEAVLDVLLQLLMASQAELVLVNLEDLWLETAPQNTPGTWIERPNWQRKLKRSLDSLLQDEVLRLRLMRLAANRNP